MPYNSSLFYHENVLLTLAIFTNFTFLLFRTIMHQFIGRKTWVWTQSNEMYIIPKFEQFDYIAFIIKVE